MSGALEKLLLPPLFEMNWGRSDAEAMVVSLLSNLFINGFDYENTRNYI